MISACEEISEPSSRVIVRVVPVRIRTIRTQHPREEVDRARQRQREAFGMGERQGLGHELGEDDREQGEDHGHDEQRGELGIRRADAGRLEQILEAGREFDRRVGRGEEADECQPELRDGEEAARLVEEAANAARRTTPLLHELIHP